MAIRRRALSPQPSVLAPSRGFTLIEILVVVAIIAITAGLASLAFDTDDRGSVAREAKRFAGALARRLVDDHPDTFVATASKAQRKGLVFVDWLRNADGATAVAAWSLRARDGLPVSMPIAWSDLATDVRGAHFNIRNVPMLLARRRSDPWAGYEDTRQRLTAARFAALERSRSQRPR